MIVLVLFVGFFPHSILAAEATTGAVVGTVSGDSGPLAGVRVAAAAPSGHASTVTDARGSFTLLGLTPDTYVVTAELAGYESATDHVTVVVGQTTRVPFALSKEPKTIANVNAANHSYVVGSTADTFVVSGAEAQASAPTTSGAGLANYTKDTVQGAIAAVPGVDLDEFANAILRGGKVSDAVFDYDSIPIPQGLIAEPGGNIDGAQLPTTGVGATTTTLGGYSNEGDNTLAGVINEVAAVGTYPSRTDIDLADGVAGAQLQFLNAQYRGASSDQRWRYAFAVRSESEYLPYGDGESFYPAEAATYGLALQDRSDYSFETNVHYRMGANDDLSLLAFGGQARYQQYGSPFPGETISGYDGEFGYYPGYANQNAPVNFASSIKGSFDAFKLEWLHTGGNLLSRVQVYHSFFGSAADGPFWDENGFPDGAISIQETSAQRQAGVNYDATGDFGRNQLKFGAEYRSNYSLLNQIVPTGFEFIHSQPTLNSELAYLGDTYRVGPRLELSGTGRLTDSLIRPAFGTQYSVGAIDPHFATSYRIGNDMALRATFDHNTVAPAPLEADRTDSTNLTADGNPAPFVSLQPETSNDFTYSFETGGRVQFRATYYQEFEKNLIDVLPFNFRSALAAGLNPNGVGVPTNVGDLRANGFETNLRTGGFEFDANLIRAFSSSASQYAFNDLNAPAVAAGHLFPVSYEPDLTIIMSYEFKLAHRHLRIKPSLSYQTGYPYGNGRDIYIFNPTTNKPELVPNDNYYNPGYNYYFLANPANPFNAQTNPYIGNMGTPEGSDPNTLRSMPQVLANLHAEVDLAPRATLVLDVTNVFGEFAATAYQGNPYLIGPPGYAGGNLNYEQAIGAYAYPCSGTNCSSPLYTLGNGVPTNDGQHAIVPWSYGRAGYVPQSYPMGRTIELRLKYSM